MSRTSEEILAEMDRSLDRLEYLIDEGFEVDAEDLKDLVAEFAEFAVETPTKPEG